jgi:cholesterol oxidase
VPRPLDLALSLHWADLARLRSDAAEPGRVGGAVRAPGLHPDPLTVTGGTIVLFARDPDRVDTCLMRYRLPLRTRDGDVLLLEATKVIHDDVVFDIWRDTTTAAVVVSRAGVPVAHGRVRISATGVARLLASMTVDGPAAPADRLRAGLRFTVIFAGRLVRLYGRVLAAPMDLAGRAGSPGGDR